jgi:hypothetical protein
VIRGALRRLFVVFAVIFVLTGAVSLAIGALAHANLQRALADGFYVAGSAILVGSFVLGVRGPLRADWGQDDRSHPTHLSDRPITGVLPRRVRRSTPEERVEARHNSLALFALGIVLLLVGGGFDPTRRLF